MIDIIAKFSFTRKKFRGIAQGTTFDFNTEMYPFSIFREMPSRERLRDYSFWSETFSKATSHSDYLLYEISEFLGIGFPKYEFFKNLDPFPLILHEIWKIHMSERLYPKILKFCAESGLSETSVWPMFQVKIRNYNFLRKM